MVNYIGFKAEGMGFDAHLTVLHTGELTPAQELMFQYLLKEWKGHRTFWVLPDHFDLFGPNKSIPVLIVNIEKDWNDPKPHMIELREYLESNWPVSQLRFKPHITLKLPAQKTLKIPPRIRLVNLGLY